jgi:hypothetical protein
MSTWVGVTPLIGAGSLDGFAVGALMSGACSLAIVAPRRGRRRQIAAACHGLALAVGRPEQEGQHVRPADVFGVGSEPVAQPEEPARGGRPAVGRHRLANPDGVLAGRFSPGDTRRGDGTRPGSNGPGSTWPGNTRPGGTRTGGALRDMAPPSRTSRHAAFPESAFPGPAPAWDGAHPDAAHPQAAHSEPDAAFPDLAFPDGAPGPSRPEGRRPRHAAPPAGFSSRINSLMTGLAAARVLASSTHG